MAGPRPWFWVFTLILLIVLLVLLAVRALFVPAFGPRLRVAAALPRLRSLDVIAITKEDRARADAYAHMRAERLLREQR